MIMSRLNKEFEKLDFEKSELAYQEFERCKRNPGQPMTSYLRDMDRTYTKMIKEDEGTRLSEVTLARRLLRRSGLNHDEQRHVLASCGHEYNLDKIRTALRLTYGDANRDGARRRFSQTPKASPTHKKPPFRRFKKHGVNHMDALPEEDPHQEDHGQEEGDHEEDNDEEDDDEQPVEDERPEDEDEEGSDIDEDDEQLWEIFYQGLKAGKKPKSASKGWKKPAGRGRGGHRPSSSSSSNVTQVTKEKTGKCFDCGQFGHWKGDPECARVQSGHTPPFKKHGTNVIYYSLTNDYDHDEEQTMVTPLYPDDSDDMLDWTPDEEVTEWNPNPPIVNPPWIPYVVDWQPPPPAESPPRIVDLDELENGTSDLIDLNIQDDDEDIHIQYIEISAGQLDHLHKIDEHPLTTSQVETMKCTIDEETFPEIPLPEDDVLRSLEVHRGGDP